MNKIRLTTEINSPKERCFNLCRSMDLHIESTSKTKEKAIAGVTTGLIGQGDFVTWEAVHFGIKQQLTVKIMTFDSPNHFRDSQIKGIFKTFIHDHYFEEKNGITVMTDILYTQYPYGILGIIIGPFINYYLKQFLKQRNDVIKRIAESEDWRLFLK